MSKTPRSYRRLWLTLFSVITLSFLALGYYGREIYYQAPPIPQRVVTADGTVLFTDTGGQRVESHHLDLHDPSLVRWAMRPADLFTSQNALD